jgi:DNA-binding NtrC family response regulator
MTAAARSVLFVDDEPRVLEGLRDSLRRERVRWRMRFVDDARAGLRELDRDPPDVVVSDLRMPCIRGTTFLALVEAWYPATKRIVLSGHLGDWPTRDTEQAHRLLSKPCDPETLMRALEDVTAEPGS